MFDDVRPSASEVKRHLKGNIGLFVPVIAVSVYTTLDKTMLGVMSTEEQVAFFSYSETTPPPAQRASSAGRGHDAPYVVSAYGGAEREGVGLLKNRSGSCWQRLWLWRSASPRSLPSSCPFFLVRVTSRVSVS